MKKFILIILFFPLLSLGAEPTIKKGVKSGDDVASDPEAFPITINFKSSRNFGFHVGDEIPLAVTLEAKKGSVIDLVNIPKEKETHGQFEIRKVRIGKRRKSDRTVYTVSYRLQSFEPAVAVDRLNFPALRISYATEQDWNPKESQYQYQTLFTQSYELFVSRTATYSGPMKDIVGPITDGKAALLWKLMTFVGGLMVLVALTNWTWGFIRRRRRHKRPSAFLTAGDRAFKALNAARENCFNYEDHRKHLFVEVNAILRDFLKEVHGLDSANLPSTEIVQQLKGHPFYEELCGLVARINQVVYEGDAPADVESIVRQFSALLKNIDGIAPPGAKDDKAG